ncbi:MAG TPA: DUF1802 family protein [Thermoanaerobaculia bacterium]|nr:DUF1802 family protein [Thermoanaerobaculia bacterium]
MTALPNHTALKEWASVNAALAGGDQIILLRKGGIADPRFGLEADRFYLFPTYLHQKEKQFKPEKRSWFAQTDREDTAPSHVSIRSWAEVTGVDVVSDLETLLALEPHVIFTRETIEERYRFRPDQAVHVLTLRVWNLPEPVNVQADRPEYHGCVSWISLEEPIDVEGSVPALSDSEIGKLRRPLREVLSAKTRAESR